MSENSFGYDEEHIAKNYAKYRPKYPSEIYEKILNYLSNDSKDDQRRAVAVDVGCGTGQSTVPLSPYFDTVIGVDSSKAQLDEAIKVSHEYKNVQYKLGLGEELSSLVNEDSVDLITVATALHWMDLEKFYGECVKVLKPGGVIAAYVCTCAVARWENEQANIYLRTFFLETLKEYFSAHIHHAFNDCYREISLPMSRFFCDCLRDETISMTLNWSLKEIMGLLMSLPEYINYKNELGEDSEDILEKLQGIFETTSLEDKVVKSYSPMVMLFGKKAKKQ